MNSVFGYFFLFFYRVVLLQQLAEAQPSLTFKGCLQSKEHKTLKAEPQVEAAVAKNDVAFEFWSHTKINTEKAPETMTSLAFNAKAFNFWGACVLLRTKTCGHHKFINLLLHFYPALIIIILWLNSLWTSLNSWP